MRLKSLHFTDGNKRILDNFSYMTLIQVYMTIIPLFTYPYLVKVLGLELYGLVIISQVIAGFCSILVDFGFKSVSARHISINRNDTNKLSIILSSIISIRFVLWIISFIIYMFIILCNKEFSAHFTLFFFAFFATFNELLFPQFFFQGVEKMRSITYINLISKTLFISLIFIFVKHKSAYILVPLFTSVGYFIGGIISLYIIRYRFGVKWIKPTYQDVKFYFLDAMPMFATNAICSIKDRIGYIFVSSLIGMGDVVIYDLGVKLINLLSMPATSFNMVIFPSLSKDWKLKRFLAGGLVSMIITVIGICIANVFLPQIASFMINKDIDLLPIRLLSISPLFLILGSHIALNYFVANGNNKFMLRSIIVTTIVYCFSFGCVYLLGKTSLLQIVTVVVFTYFIEFMYRLIFFIKR